MTISETSFYSILKQRLTMLRENHDGYFDSPEVFDLITSFVLNHSLEISSTISFLKSHHYTNGYEFNRKIPVNDFWLVHIVCITIGLHAEHDFEFNVDKFRAFLADFYRESLAKSVLNE